MFSFFLKLLFLASLITFNLFGSNPKKVYKLEDYVVTAARLNQNIFDLSPSVSAFNKDDIENGTYVNLTDILWQIPGTFLVPNGGIGKAASLFTRGSESNHTAILFNGRRMPTGFAGQYDLGVLGLANLDSVEFVRGDCSSLYGGGISGVINLRTSDFINSSSQSLKLERGSNNFNSINYNNAYINKSTVITLGLERLNSDGFQPNSDFKRASNNLYLKKNLNNDLTFDFQYFSYSTELGVPGSNADPDKYFSAYPSEERNNTEAWLISPGLIYKPSNDLEFKLTINLNENQLSAFSAARYDDFFNAYTPKDAGYLLQEDRDKIFKERIKGVEAYALFNIKRVNSNNILGFLLEDRDYEESPYRAEGSSKVFNLGYETRSLFFQSLTKIDSFNTIKLGARYDKYSKLFHSNRSWNIEVSRFLNADKTFRVFAKRSLGAIPPSMNDVNLFGSSSDIDFKLEKISTKELGLKKTYGGNEIGLTYFNNELRDLADYSSEPPTYKFEYALIDTKQNGVETYLKGLIFKQINYFLSYSYLDAHILSGRYFGGSNGKVGDQMVRRPMHKFYASFIFVPSQNYNVGMSYLAGWKRQDTSGEEFEPIESMRLFGSYNVSENSSLFIRVENALNQSYEYTGGYPAPPKQTFIGARFNF